MGGYKIELSLVCTVGLGPLARAGVPSKTSVQYFDLLGSHCSREIRNEAQNMMTLSGYLASSVVGKAKRTFGGGC